MGAETLTGRIVNAIDLIDGILDAGSIRDYTSRDQLIFMREQLTSMASCDTVPHPPRAHTPS